MIRVFAWEDLPLMDIIELQGRIAIPEEALRAARLEEQQHHKHPRQRPTQPPCGGCDGAAMSEATSCVLPGKHASETEGCTAPPVTSLSTSASDTEVSSDSEDGEHRDRSGSRKRADGAAAVEMFLGHIEQDHINEKRCTLSIDTQRVHGSRSTLKHPWLVLRECTPARMRHLRRCLLGSGEGRDPLKGGDDAREAAAVDGKRSVLKMESSSNGGSGMASPSSSASAVTPAADSDETMLFSDWLQRHPEALSLDHLFLEDLLPARTATDLSVASATEVVDCDGGGDANAGQRKRRRDEGAEEEDQARMLCKSCTAGAAASQTSASPAPTSTTTLSATSPSEYKNYELVGVVRGSVLFNSKPARVFQ